jgi:transposase-like protein
VPGYSEDAAREAVRESLSYAETLRRLGLCATGGNAALLKRWLARWHVSTDHFDPRASIRSGSVRAKPMHEILVERSTYSRSNLKLRLYSEGLKAPRCEMCGQGEQWRGKPMGLVLDHVNGVRDDLRLANLRIVCPNCAATLETHCGRKNRLERPERPCELCGVMFRARYPRQRYCSRKCGTRSPAPNRGIPNHELRRAERPARETLLREIAEMGFTGVGRKYGVSDNAIRKWVQHYEHEAAVRHETRVRGEP